MKKILKAVIFDVDGVITNTMPYHFRAWVKTFRDEGIIVSRQDIYKREGQKGIISVREIFTEHARILSVHRSKLILARKEYLFKKILRQRFIPGARSFIKLLASKGTSLALVTGTSRHEIEKILPANLRNRFAVIITGNDVNIGKPHPEPYWMVKKKLGVSSKDAVVIENAPFGIRSAKAAGLTCFAIETSLPKIYLREADLIFRNVHSLKVYMNQNYCLSL